MFQDQTAITQRQPITCYFVIDSNDRNDANSSIENVVSSADRQPWNDFRLQKPAPLLDGFAKRIGIAEVNFTWAIPNITPRNNVMQIVGAGMPGGAYTLTVPAGFYTAAELITAINTDLSNNVVNPPVFSYSSSQMVFTITPNASNNNLQIRTSATQTYTQYIETANLAKTMGFSFAQCNNTFTAAAPLVGSTTKLQYTSYVDIASSKMNYYSEIKDGSSARRNVSDQLARVYCADEMSPANMATVPGTRPFIIHRQFANPKYVKWNPQNMLDWIDVQVYDEWGQLVYIPAGPSLLSYPDFQITCLASES